MIRKLISNPAVPGTLLVPLTQGRFAVVDESDGELVGSKNWHFGSRGYAYASVRNYVGIGRYHTRNVALHSLLMRPSYGVEVDHINHDPLDNRRSNLRLCSIAENARNRRPRNKFKGVCWNKKSRKWQAAIITNRKATFLGLYVDAADAARAYDAAASTRYGSFALLNFPSEAK